MATSWIGCRLDKLERRRSILPGRCGAPMLRMQEAYQPRFTLPGGLLNKSKDNINKINIRIDFYYLSRIIPLP
jgi:hypothetical protein